MDDRFSWKGIPIRDAQNNVLYVKPVRGIVAPNGITYPGVLDHDAEGSAFTYNQVPNVGIGIRVLTIEDGRVLTDGEGRVAIYA